MDKKPVIAIMMGDATGVGPEILAKLASRQYFQEYCRPVLVGDEKALKLGLEQAKTSAVYTVIDDVEKADADGCLYLYQMDGPAEIPVGKVSAEWGAFCVSVIKTVIQWYQDGKIDGICFAPLNKGAMLEGGSPAPSETELYAMLLGQKSGYGEINMLDGVWTTRVTSHIPVSRISEHLTKEGILSSIDLAYRTLVQAGYEEPRIGVSALNPHCGEGGKCGREEIELIAPAVAEAAAKGWNVSGPYSADILFAKAFGGQFDAIVTMYHDQGQIALKLKGFERGITIAGGFPVPITTCAHGTAHDIAGKGIAGTTSFENAFKTVCQMASGSRK